jgi:hypothetical protein
MAPKANLVRRAVAEFLFSARAFWTLWRKARSNDVVLTVTAPFMLPYGVVLAAALRGARSALIMHDFYPDVLVMAGVLKPRSIATRAIRLANVMMFQAVSAIVAIGRDTERLLLRYPGVTRNKIRLIPNWATLAPGVRSIDPHNRYRPQGARFLVGLSGNLGFTHDPEVVFEAARLLQGCEDIHFLLSGWGVGFEQLRALQASTNLPNVTLIDRVNDRDLECLLAAADIWLIPYRKNMAGISVPSRLYNLLAVGRPVIVVSEAEAEAALVVRENNLGWVVMPGCLDELAKTILAASTSLDASMPQRAVFAAERFSLDRAMESYVRLIDELSGDT